MIRQRLPQQLCGAALNQFEQVAQPIHDKISVISKSILQLQTARDHLLPKLMNGEVEV